MFLYTRNYSSSYRRCSEICDDLIKFRNEIVSQNFVNVVAKRQISFFDILIPREILIFLPSHFHDEITFHRDVSLSVENFHVRCVI